MDETFSVNSAFESLYDLKRTTLHDSATLRPVPQPHSTESTLNSDRHTHNPPVTHPDYDR